MNKISAVIITFNEERNIARCLDSLQGIVDEIVVVDSFSTDKTEEICNRYGAKFIQHAFEGHIEQKNWALTQSSYPYVLSLDADEVLDKTLQQSIFKAKSTWSANGYSMNRLTNYCGKWIKHCGWYPDTKLRLFDKRKGAWGGINPHDIYKLHNTKEKTAPLQGNILHYSYKDIHDHLERANKYTTLIAKGYFEKGKKATWFKLTFAGPFCFFKDFLIRQGWRDGWRGLTICRIAANSTHAKYAKLKEMEEQQKKASLIITTYNRPDALELVLLSVLRQSYMPQEVIIADDGSTYETKELITKYQKLFPVPLIHCWQEDDGFQLSRIRNKAIAQSNYNYLIMVDGDMVLSKNFVLDHIHHAQHSQFIQGSRVLVGEKSTLTHIKFLNPKFHFFSKGITNRVNSLNFNFLSKIISKNYGKKDHQGVRGCNMSFWKSDLIKVNGFDESFVGWGREDSEFVVRMLNNDIHRKNIKLSAAAFHLWHKENTHSTDELKKNDNLLEDAINSKKLFATKGLDQYLK